MKKNAIALVTPDTDISVAKAKEIQKLHREIVRVYVKGAKLSYQAGEMLSDIQMRTDVYQWTDWVKTVLKLSMQSVNQYLAIYEHFRGRPEELDDLTNQEAIHRSAGNFIERKARESAGRVEYGKEKPHQLELDWEIVFAKPTVSKAKLKNYRFECPDLRSLWLVRREINYAVKFMDLYTDRPNNALKHPYEAMMKTIQGAVELYFEKVEQTEITEKEDA